jgi:hypothetical protein
MPKDPFIREKFKKLSESWLEFAASYPWPYSARAKESASLLHSDARHQRRAKEVKLLPTCDYRGLFAAFLLAAKADIRRRHELIH